MSHELITPTGLCRYNWNIISANGNYEKWDSINVKCSSLLELTSDCRLFGPDYAQTKIFDPFDLNDEKDYIPCADINPDSYYYNDLSFLFNRIAIIIMKTLSISPFKESSMTKIPSP